jgi:signal peptidase II
MDLSRLLRYRLLLVLAAAVFVADQVTKELVYQNIAYGGMDGIVVIPGFFNIIHVGNTGAAWGLFQDSSVILALIGIVTLGIMVAFRRQLGMHLVPVQVAFGLLNGGVVGNIVDRLRHGHVVDFLDFHFGSFVWPTFNIADCGIVVGVGLYMYLSFRHPALRP